MAAQGMVVAAHAAAAQAGAQVMRDGGNAVDAAVATAAALAVADPANCGLAGYGGFMVVHRPGDAAPACVDFNTAVPSGLDATALAQAPRTGAFVHGGVSVSVPCVVAGLDAAHAAFARLPRAALFAPAIALAAQGVTVSADLARSIAWAATRHGGVGEPFRRVFCGGAAPLAEGATLRQPELADTLRLVADEGADALRSGPLADAIAACVAADGGPLHADDLRRASARSGPTQRARFGDATVYGPPRDGSGFGVLADALAALDGVALGDSRGGEYVSRVAGALNAAWERRRADWSLLIAEARHTTHFCTADAEGMLVACTLTHGPLWFGSGLVAPGTGLVLNAGANLCARHREDGRLAAITNLTPTLVACADGSRHAVGSPGGARIPAIVLQAVLDLVHYGVALDDALALPRVSVDAAGRLEAEPPLAERVPAARRLEPSIYYGPAAGISISRAGALTAAPDPRFAASAVCLA